MCTQYLLHGQLLGGCQILPRLFIFSKLLSFTQARVLK